MKTEKAATYWARIYMSGPVEVAKQVIRKDCLRKGLCVTVDPTTFIYSGGEETGFVIGFVNYPRFPVKPQEIRDRAMDLMHQILDATHQHSAMLVTPEETVWVSKRESA